MPSLEVWGPAVWTLFHTLAERVSEDAYPFIINQLFSQIVKICKVLPCPDCSTHASIFLEKINVQTLKTKTDFRNLMYLFHNYVNVTKRKPLFNVVNLNMYRNYRLIPVVNNFLINFNTKGNMNLINESFQRSLVQNNFKKWLSGNIKAFTQQTIFKNHLLTEEHILTEEPILTEEHILTEEPILTEEHILTEEPILTKEHILTEVSKHKKNNNKKKNKKKI
jgi:hypothetical protein